MNRADIPGDLEQAGTATEKPAETNVGRGVALVTTDRATERHRYVITSERVIVGRSRDCDIVIKTDSVSRMHASIFRRDDSWWIQNFISSNGTYVNERKVKDAQLRHGDRIRLGSMELEFHALPRLPFTLPKWLKTLAARFRIGRAR